MTAALTEYRIQPTAQSTFYPEELLARTRRELRIKNLLHGQQLKLIIVIFSVLVQTLILCGLNVHSYIILYFNFLFLSSVKCESSQMRNSRIRSSPNKYLSHN